MPTLDVPSQPQPLSTGARAKRMRELMGQDTEAAFVLEGRHFDTSILVCRLNGEAKEWLVVVERLPSPSPTRLPNVFFFSSRWDMRWGLQACLDPCQGARTYLSRPEGEFRHSTPVIVDECLRQNLQRQKLTNEKNIRMLCMFSFCLGLDGQGAYSSTPDYNPNDPIQAANLRGALISFLRGKDLSALEDPQLRLQVVHSLERLGECGMAEKLAQDMVDKPSLDPEDTQVLAELLRRFSRPERSLRVLEAGVLRFPDVLPLADAAALGLLEQERYSEAVSFIVTRKLFAWNENESFNRFCSVLFAAKETVQDEMISTYAEAIVLHLKEPREASQAWLELIQQELLSGLPSTCNLMKKIALRAHTNLPQESSILRALCMVHHDNAFTCNMWMEELKQRAKDDKLAAVDYCVTLLGRYGPKALTEIREAAFAGTDSLKPSDREAIERWLAFSRTLFASECENLAMALLARTHKVLPKDVNVLCYLIHHALHLKPPQRKLALSAYRKLKKLDPGTADMYRAFFED